VTGYKNPHGGEFHGLNPGGFFVFIDIMRSIRKTMGIVILCFCIWYISGVASFIYWWTKDFDFTSGEALTAAGMGFCGPFAYQIGYSIHNKSDNVIIKKRDKIIDIGQGRDKERTDSCRPN
jgi:hypothetical protein